MGKSKQIDCIICVVLWLSVFVSAGLAGTSWRFIVTGDSWGYDHGVNTAILGELAGEVVNQKVDFVLFSGDLVLGFPGEAFEGQLARWLATMEPVYDANIDVYTCRGNHENFASVAVWQGVFDYLPDNGPAEESYLTYSVRHKNAFIVAVDEYVNSHRVNQAWLNGQFAANTEPHIFVFGHEPAFQAYHSACLDDYPAARDAFWSSIKKAGGRVYFCGHDHFFDHAVVDDGDGDPNNDVHQYIIGTAGAPFYSWLPPYDGNNSGYAVQQCYHARKYGYVLVEIEGLNAALTWMERDSNNLQIPGAYEPKYVCSYAAMPIMLLAPNGGQALAAASKYNIRWQTYEGPNIEHVLIEYSADDGRNWNQVDIWPNTGSYEWIIPPADSNQCIVRVSDVNNPAISDTSYDVFTIFRCPGPILGDVNGDCYVDFLDFAAVASHWLECGNRFDPACGLE